jgi:hypothetical protein
VVENLVDDRLILDAGNHFGFASALWTNRYIYIEYPLQALCPGHGLVPLFGCFVFVFLSGATFAAFGWRHINTVFAVGCKNTVKPCQIHSRLRDQRRQLGNDKLAG